MLKKFIPQSVAAFAVLLAGCSSAPATKESTPSAKSAAECVFPRTDKPAPLWVCDGPVEGVSVSAVGTASESKAGYDFMKQMAATSARVQLAQQFKVQVQNMVKQYAETTGAATSETVDKVNTSVTKQITDATLEGTRIFRSVVAPDGTMYVLVGLDEGSKQKAVESAVKTSMNSDRAVWQQFRAQKGQDELASEIAKQRAEAKAKE